MGLVETKLYGLWFAKQINKADRPATAIKRVRQVTGNLRNVRADGREKFGTDSRWGDAQYFIDSLTGDGDPGIQTQPGVLAYLLYLFAGQEAVVGAGDPYTHTINPGTTPFWCRVWKKVGTTDIVREVYNECKIGAISIEGSTGQKVVRVTPSILSVDPGEKFATEPVKTLDADDAFVYTEGEAAFEIGDVAIRAQSQFNITLNENLDPVYTDSVIPLDLAAGEPECTVGLTLALNEEGLSRYNTELYGVASPTTGTKPVKAVPATSKYDFLLTKSVNRTFAFTLAGVKWTPDVAIEPNPAGGAAEVSLTGEMRKVGVLPEWEAIIKTADPAFV